MLKIKRKGRLKKLKLPDIDRQKGDLYMLNIIYAIFVVGSFVGTIGSLIALPFAIIKKKNKQPFVLALLLNLFVLIVSCLAYKPS